MARARAARVLGAVLRLPGLGDHWPRHVSGRRPRSRAARRSGHRSVAATRVVVHDLAGRALDAAHDRRRAPRRVRGESLRVSRASRGAGARDRSLRAADGGGRLRVRRAARARRPVGLARPRPDGVGDPACTRLLQLRRGRAHGRRALGAPRSAPGGGCARARSYSLARVPRGHAPRAPTRARGGGCDRVLVHVHVVRRDPHSGRPAVRDARDRDLSPDRAAPEPRRGRRARPSCSSLR